MKAYQRQDVQQAAVQLFNCVIITDRQKRQEVTVTQNGVVVDFTATPAQLAAVHSVHQPIDIRTLFTPQERENKSVHQLLIKQVLHYMEIYGLDQPGLFDLEVNTGVIQPMVYVQGITVQEMQQRLLSVLYRNAPVQNAELFMKLITAVKLQIDINAVANNELRVLLYDHAGRNAVLENGDDAVRYLCVKLTGNSMLIKDASTVHAFASHPARRYIADFLQRHEVVLSKVFNRHKKLLMSLKPQYSNTINRISRLSKRNHVPIVPHISKRFVTEALSGTANRQTLQHVSLRDQFKYLNLLNYKLEGYTTDCFVIRNGRMHVRDDRPVYQQEKIHEVMHMVIESISDQLAHLKSQSILLDAAVDYGLPISRKQSVGKLPFGTTVTVPGKISAGIYWENSWGARDLDLSTVDRNGHRTGWGTWSGYSKTNPIRFSGDITDATRGAMEFMTSKNQEYGLFANIFSGDNGSEFELVVGTGDHNKNQWIQSPLIREKAVLQSRGCVIGFVRNNKFVVYSGRLNEKLSNHCTDTDPVIARGLSAMWCVSDLLTACGVDFSVDRDPDVQYNHDLTYTQFSWDKLEKLLLD